MEGVKRIVVTILVALAALLPAVEHASAAWTGGHDARITHAPRTPPRAARVTVLTVIDPASMAAWLPAAGAVPAPPDAARPSRPLAAPFVPPRG